MALDGGERKQGDYATAKKGILLPGSAAKLNAQGNMPRNSIKRSLSSKNIFVGSIRLSGGKQLCGVFKREILQRKTKTKPQTTRLKVLAVFKDRVTYKKNPKIDIMKIGSKRFDTVFNKPMSDAINDLNKLGRVKSSNQRNK